MIRRYVGARAIVFIGVAALAASGCATERAAARPARAEVPAATAASDAQPRTIYIDISQATPAAARVQGPDVKVERTRIIEAPAPTAAVQIPPSRVVIEPQAPRILVDQRSPEVVIGELPQPQLYLRAGGGDGGGQAASAVNGGQGEFTKVIRLPGPTVTVDLPRPRVVIQPEPARVIVNQQPPEVVLEAMPPPQISAEGGASPSASPRTR